MKLLLANLASPANPGDQAILRGTLKLLREYFKNPEITVSTRAYSEKAVYEALGCRVIPSYPDVECLATDSKWGKISRIPRALADAATFKEAVRQSDLVFLVGGAYFYSYRNFLPGLTFLAHATASHWAKKYGKKVIFMPQSYGPFSSRIARGIFTGAVKNASVVFYREMISGDWLGRGYPKLHSRFVFMPDSALYLEEKDLIHSKPVQSPLKKIGITIRPWPVTAGAEDRYFEALSQSLRRLQEEAALAVRIIVQVQDSKKAEGDEGISRRLYESLGGDAAEGRLELHCRRPYFSLEEIAALYAGCDLLIGMRLHSALLGFIVGCPALVTGYQHKAEGIMQSMGLRELYLGDLGQVNAETLEKNAKRILDQKDAIKRKIADMLRLEREQTREIFKTQMKWMGL
jgi:colanic acid/amylovoran biosynthesis protein